jgi:CheY-like chemotaxis protein
MPDADGFELMELIQTGLNLSTPVVMMSTDDGDVRLKSLRSGAAQFLPKPVRPDELQSLWQVGLTSGGATSRAGSDSGSAGAGAGGPARSTSLDQLDEAGVAAGMGAGALLLQRRSAELARSAPGTEGYVPPVSSSRVERLLREREMRRVRSLTGLNLENLEADALAAAAEAAPSPVPMRTREPSVENLATMAEPEPRQRLLVVANRLPVSAKKRADGAWALEVRRRARTRLHAALRCAYPALATLQVMTRRILTTRPPQISAGGLVSALLGIQQNYDICWIGWPGAPRAPLCVRVCICLRESPSDVLHVRCARGVAPALQAW